jgi:hypothetical protein
MNPAPVGIERRFARLFRFNLPLPLAALAAFELFIGACTTDSGNPSNGAAGASMGGSFAAQGGSAGAASGLSGRSGMPGGSGGSGGGNGAAGTCSNGAACGGNLVGTWNVTSSCLTVGGELDLSLFGAGCPTAPVTGSRHVSGTWTANADGTYTDGTTTTGTEQFTLVPACLVISSTPVTCEGAAGLLKTIGYATLQCTPSSAGGCSCAGTVNQAGSLGLLSFAPSTSGTYSTSGSVATITGDSGDANYSYCVANDTLTVTPTSTNPSVTGSIVLQKAGSMGVGGGAGMAGASGTSGAAGSVASAGAGGTAGTGASAGAGGVAAMGGRAGGAGMPGIAGNGAGGSGSTTGPCDIYKAAGNPCVAAHSTVRALYGNYAGKLYQVRNAANATLDIMPLAPGGVADGLAQDAFCMGTTCVITVVYDQSGKGNDLWYQGSTQVPGSTSSSPAKATTESLTLGGHKVYSLYINAGNSYWVDASKSGIALGAEPEGMYMVTSGKHSNGGCCFDYGNSETDRKADGSGAMDALNFSSITAWGTGAGNGPWVMADLEYGEFAQNNTNKNQNDPTQTSAYVTAVLKNNGTSEFALRGGDASMGNLGTYYKGGLPGGWSPMKKQGAIVLGSGGDCCKPGGGANLSAGTFYEGCIVTGYPSDATEDAVQANVVAAKYGK